VIIVVALLVLCAGSHVRTPEGDGFPDLPGFSLVREEHVYTPDNLWDLIDGAADLFLEYRFVDLHLARYLRSDSAEIRLEVYRHASPEDAFGMYAVERATDYKFFPVGTQGYRAEGVVNFFCGSLYVKVTTLDSSQSMQDALVDLAGRTVSASGQPCAWPPVLSLLPSRGKIANSEQFVQKGFLGYTCFKGTYSASYSPGGRIFIVAAADTSEVQRIVQAYRSAVNDAGILRSGGSLTFIDPHNGRVELLFAGRYLCGVYDCQDDSARDFLLRSLKESFALTR